MPLRTARDHYLAALDPIVERRYQEAVPLLEQATDRDPKGFWAWLLLGFCHDGLQNDHQALSSYNACAALADDFYAVYHRRGLVHFRQRNFGRAGADFSRAVEIARQQGAKLLELQAALRLHALCLDHGRPEPSRGMLQRAYESFAPDALDIPELQEARALLSRSQAAT